MSFKLLNIKIVTILTTISIAYHLLLVLLIYYTFLPKYSNEYSYEILLPLIKLHIPAFFIHLLGLGQQKDTHRNGYF